MNSLEIPKIDSGHLKRKVKGEFKFCPNKISKLEPTGNKLKDITLPNPRSGHRIVVKDGNVYAFGGYNPVANEGVTDNVLFQELWRYNCASKTWKLLETTGKMPDELASHCAILVDNHMIIYGGTGVPFGESSSNSTHICNLEELKWSKLETSGTPPLEQYGQAMAIYNDKIYVVGGTTGFTYSMSVHCLDLKTRKWELLEKDNASRFDWEPRPRYRHEIAIDDNKIYIFGGGTSFESFTLKKIPVFNIETCTWSKIKTCLEFPEARKCHGCVQMDDDVYICGGHDGNTIFSDIWRFNLKSLQWYRFSAELPTSVYFHSAALSKAGQLFVFGGVNSIHASTENTRTNELYSMWLKIPTLAEVCWQAVLKYIPQISRLEKHRVYEAGVPHKYIKEVDFDVEPDRLKMTHCCNLLHKEEENGTDYSVVSLRYRSNHARNGNQ